MNKLLLIVFYILVIVKFDFVIILVRQPAFYLLILVVLIGDIYKFFNKKTSIKRRKVRVKKSGVSDGNRSRTVSALKAGRFDAAAEAIDKAVAVGGESPELAVLRDLVSIGVSKGKRRKTDFPALTMLMFHVPADQVPVGPLRNELSQVSASNLDEIASRYLKMLEYLVAAVENTEHPLHAEAPGLVLSLSDRNIHFTTRFRDISGWWSLARPVLYRGGGLLIAILRLLAMGLHEEAWGLYKSIAVGGMVSEETATAFELTAFYRFWMRKRISIVEDVDSFFSDGKYHGILEMGLLRYPWGTSEPIVGFCRNLKKLAGARDDFIERLLLLWKLLPGDLDVPAAFALRRLLYFQGRKTPLHSDFWESEWRKIRENHNFVAKERLMAAAGAFSNEEYGRAREILKEIIVESPGLPALSTAAINLCLVEWKAGNQQEALRKIEWCTRKFSGDSAVLAALGRMAAVEMADRKNAENLLKRALEINDGNIEALLMLGNIKLSAGEYMESVHFFRRATEMEPSPGEAYIGLARNYLELRRFKLALRYLHEAIPKLSGEGEEIAWFLLYRVYREMEEDKKALEFLDRLPDSFFNDPETLEDIAMHLESRSRYKKARTFSSRAMLLRLRNPNYRELGGDDLNPAH